MTNRLRQIRKECGFRQQELAVRAGVSPALLVAVERYGHTPGPGVRGRIATALGVPEALVWPKEPEDPPGAEHDGG